MPLGNSLSETSLPKRRNVWPIHFGVTLATAIFIVYGSWVPFQFRSLGTDVAFEQLRSILAEPWHWRGSRIDWAINSLITIPLGFSSLGALLAGRRGLVRSTSAVLLVLVAAVCLSIVAELGQLWLDGRVTSLKDVVAQAIGTVTGIGLYLLAGQSVDAWLAEFISEHGPEDRMQWVLHAYVVGFVGYSMLPLDIAMSTGELARKFDSDRIEIIPFSYAYESLWHATYSYSTQVFLAIPIGMWGTVAYRRRGATLRNFMEALLWAVGVLITIELAQLFLISRFTSTTDVLVGTVGAITGVAVMRRLQRRHPAGQSLVYDHENSAFGWLAAFTGYAILLAIVFLAPYDFTGDRSLIKQRLEAFQSMPLARLHSGSDLHSLFGTIRMAVWFAPFGALGAFCVTRWATSRRTSRFWLVIMALIVAGWALVIELGQVLLPSRFADLTDVMVCTAGGWLGLAVTARMNALRARTEVLSKRP